MQQYLDLLKGIVRNGVPSEDRTGTGTIAVFGMQQRYRLTHGFPLLTTKKVHLKSIIHELLWMISGQTNVKYLQDNGVTIWDEWAREDGELGPVYGAQWRNFDGEHTRSGIGLDQLVKVIEDIKTNPFSRRHIVTAWNPLSVDDMALPPCHMMFQFNVRKASAAERLAHAGGLSMSKSRHARYSGETIVPEPPFNASWTQYEADRAPEYALDCLMYQRSADAFLGVPFNIASYSLLTMMVARLTNLIPGDFVHSLGNAHIYNNHREQVALQLTRFTKPLPFMEIKGNHETIDDFQYDDFELHFYNPEPAIKAPVSV